MSTPVNDTPGTDQEPWEPEHTRIVEEHHIVGPDGKDEIEATDDCGRHWYDLRPEPRSRADVMGLNRTWWLVFAVFIIIIAFFPW
jgi:hypothetical protein